MKFRKAVIVCGVISAMIIAYVLTGVMKEDKCWYSTIHHYKAVLSSYAKQVFS